MIKFKKSQLLILITASIISLVPLFYSCFFVRINFPESLININENDQVIANTKSQYLTLSWGDIWRHFRRLKKSRSNR